MKSRDLMRTPLAAEVELRSERASALRRVGFKLEKLISQIQALDAELQTLSLTQAAIRHEKIAERKRLRSEAETQRWYLIVQREAMGMTQHHDVDELYKIPEA
jgi:hypothetical protein